MRWFVVSTMAVLLALSGCAALDAGVSEEQYRAMETKRLCRYYNPGHNEGIIEIIESRDIFTEKEIEAIKEQRPRLGMGEEALKCAMGYPDRTASAKLMSRQMTEEGTVTRYGFKDTVINPTEVVFVELTDGKVTKITDD